MRRICIVLGLTAVVLGFFCLNYTNGFGIQHHAEWAKSHRMPEPTYAIFIAGALLEILGAGTLGFFIRKTNGKV